MRSLRASDLLQHSLQVFGLVGRVFEDGVGGAGPAAGGGESVDGGL